MMSLVPLLVAGALAPADGAPAPASPALVAEAPSAVMGLTIRALDGRTEVAIELDGPAELTDYILDNPVRLVLDVAGARHALPRERFPGINRGGVLAVRTSQFSPEVVRVVLELERAVEYEVTTERSRIRISFANPAAVGFQAWSVPGTEPATALPAPAPAPVVPQVQEQQPSITITFDSVPMKEVLGAFADFSGRSIVAGEGVTGMVDATIQNQPWDVALREILRGHDLVAEETPSGIIRVEPISKLKERQTTEPMITRQFRLEYVSVDSLVQNALRGVLSDSGSVTISPATNTVILRDRQSVLEQVEPIIDELDVRTPQVTISAKIIFVDRTALEELGVVWDIKDSRGNQLNQVMPGFLDDEGDGLDPQDATNENVVLLGGSSVAALANANDRIARPTLQMLSSLVLGRHTLVNFLEALQSLQFTDIQAVPSIKVLDHRSARVQVGEETPVRVLDEGSAGGGEGPRAAVNFRQTGIILEVTPHVTANQVLLQVHAERSNIALAPSDIGITFQTQEANTEVLLNDGETAVISGLTLIEKTSAHSGIPYLMDLPVLGKLFRTTRERENKRDLLIMVTPHIDKAGL